MFLWFTSLSFIVYVKSLGEELMKINRETAITSGVINTKVSRSLLPPKNSLLSLEGIPFSD